MRALLTLTVLATAPLAGQGTFRFRYDPAPNRAIASLTEMRTVTTMQGLPRVPDGTAIEVEARVFAHEMVLAQTPDGRRVEVSLDSVRVRQREGTGAWTDAPVSFSRRATRVELSPQLRVLGIETSDPEDGALLRVLTGWTANLGFAFPDTAVAVGGTFRTGGQMPFEVDLGEASGVGIHEVLLGDFAVTLDSVVPRGADTLAYLRFSGTFAPRTIETSAEDGARADVFEGGFAGNMLWSTGWDAFVSTGVRVRVTGRLHQETAAGVLDATVEWDATLVHRIRP